MKCTVCKNEIKSNVNQCSSQTAIDEQKRLESVQLCHNCDVWMAIWQVRNTSIRINGQHYTAVPSAWGMGFKATILKGRRTHDVTLMHQGEVPAPFRKALFNNAKFAQRIAVQYVG